MSEEYNEQPVQTSYDWVAGAETPAMSSTGEYVALIQNQGFDGSVLTVRISYDTGVVKINKYKLTEDAYNDFLKVMEEGYPRIVIAYLNDYGTELESIVEENPKTGTELELYLQRVYSSEALLSDQELATRRHEFLANTNQRVTDENEVVTDLDLGDIEELSKTAVSELSTELRVDLEACSRVVERVRGSFSRLVEGFKTFNRNRQTAAELGFENFSLKKVNATLKTVDYGKLVDLNLFCVPGQKVTYLALAEVLAEAFALLDKQYTLGFKPFKKWVACLVTNPQMLQSASASNTGVEVIPNSVKAKLADCFDSSNTTQAKYAKLVSRNADWEDLYQLTEKLSDLGLKLTPRTLRKETEELYQGLEQLANAIDAIKGTACSKVVTERLADYCFQFSEFLEFYSISMNITHQLAVALKDSTAKIIGIRG